MADDLDDGEFWLPSQFLTEEDIVTDFGSSSPTADVGSPDGSSVTETESDEDEFFAELTRRLSRSSLVPAKGLVLSGSPQSTLVPVGGSSRGSPTGPVSPPPTKEGFFMPETAASFDLLNAAAGEVAKLRLRLDEQPPQQKGTCYFDTSRRFLIPPAKPQTSPVSLRPDFNGFYGLKPELTRNQTNLQLPKVLSENVDYFHGVRSNNHFHNRHLGLSPVAWPPLQRQINRQPPPPPKRESVGTGVFLPRRVNVTPNPNPSPAESRKIRTRNDSSGKIRSQSNVINGPRREMSAANSTEIRLPSEWTY